MPQSDRDVLFGNKAFVIGMLQVAKRGAGASIHEGGGKEWACGQEATFALAQFIETHWVTCKGNKRDRYSRLIAVCFVGSYDLNAMMVREGWALAYRRYSTDYVDEEAAARDAGKGVWRGEFVAPWEWRRSKL